MINLLGIATDGYLCKTGPRTLLSIATRGYLGACDIIIPPIEIPNIGGGNIGYNIATPLPLKGDDIYSRILKTDDDAIVAVIKAFIKCQNEN